MTQRHQPRSQGHWQTEGIVQRTHCLVLFGSVDSDVSDGSDTSSTSTCSSLCTTWEPDEYDHHNMWNLVLGLFCHVQVGVVVESCSDEVVLVRIALSCHFALDLTM